MHGFVCVCACMHASVCTLHMCVSVCIHFCVQMSASLGAGMYASAFVCACVHLCVREKNTASASIEAKCQVRSERGVCNSTECCRTHRMMKHLEIPVLAKPQTETWPGPTLQECSSICHSQVLYGHSLSLVQPLRSSAKRVLLAGSSTENHIPHGVNAVPDAPSQCRQYTSFRTR